MRMLFDGTMIRGLALGLAVLFATTVMPASAHARSVYFHKAGVDRESFIADALYCQSLAQGVEAPAAYQPYSSNIYAAGTGALLSGFMKSRTRRGMIDNVLRTCMADKGYRRIEAPDEIDESLEKLSGDARLARLAALAAAEEPQGKVLPR